MNCLTLARGAGSVQGEKRKVVGEGKKREAAAHHMKGRSERANLERKLFF